VATAQEIHLNSGDNVLAVALDRNGKHLATGGSDGIIRVWSYQGGSRFGDKHITEFRLAGAVGSLALSPDAKYLAASGAALQDRSIRVWEVTSRRPLPDLIHEGAVLAVSFSPDARYLASGSRDKTARVWQLSSGQELLRVPHESEVIAVAFSPNGKYWAIAGRDGTAQLWELEIRSFPLDRRANFIAFSLDGKMLAAASPLPPIMLDDRIQAPASRTTDLNVWTVSNDREVPSLKEIPNSERFKLEGSVRDLSFSPDRRYLAVFESKGDREQVQIWELADRKKVPAKYELNPEIYGERIRIPLSKPVWALGGRYIAVAVGDAVSVTEIISQEEMLRLRPQTGKFEVDGGVTSLSISPDGKYLAAGSQEGTRIWEIARPEESKLLRHKAEVTAVAFSQDGKYLATAASDRTIILWELPNGRQKWRIANSDVVSTIIFSYDKRYLAAASGRTIRVWQATAGKEVKEVSRLNHNENVSDLAFVRDSQYLATATPGAIRVSLWRPADLEKEACARLGRNLTFEEWQQYLAGEPYRKTCSNLPIHPSYIEAGRSLAKTNDKEGAIAIFRRALEIEPNLKLNPRAEAQRLESAAKAEQRVRHGGELVRKGKVTEAVAAFKEAQDIDRTLAVSASSWNNLCWWGSLHNHARLVLDACEKAVALDPANGGFRDSRGLARAVTGDLTGAMEDFRFYVEWGVRSRQRQDFIINERQQWVIDLRGGKNPIDKDTLKKLLEREKTLAPVLTVPSKS
jgi:WD40 repeat protein